MNMCSVVWIVTVLNLGCVISQNVRLIPGPDKGRLEVLHNGTWGTVCTSSLTNQVASVVCRSLNQSSKNAYWVRGQKYGVGALRPRLSRVSCNGQETSLFDCSLTTPEDTTKACSSSSYVIGIVCTNEKMPAFFRYGSNWFHSAQTLDIFERDSIYCWGGNDSYVRGFRMAITQGKLLLASRSNYYTYYSPRRSQMGPFTCTVSNWQMPNQDSLTVQVNVMYPPLEFVTSKIKVLEGAAVNISLTNMPNPVPYLTTWRKTGTTLKWNQTEAYLIYTNISRADGGEFLVNISTQMNSSRNIVRQAHGLELIHVDVQYQPTVKCQQEYFVSEGSKVNITCEVESNPSPHAYIWTDDSGDIIYRGPKPSLIINSVGPKNAGRYRCTVINEMQDSQGITKSGLGLGELSVILGDLPVTIQPAPDSQPLSTVTYAVTGVAAVLLVIVLILVFVIVKLWRNRVPEGPNPRSSDISHGGHAAYQNDAYQGRADESDYTALEFADARSK